MVIVCWILHVASNAIFPDAYISSVIQNNVTSAKTHSKTYIDIFRKIISLFVDSAAADSTGIAMAKFGPYIYGAYGSHDDVIKWKHFPRYWPFVRGIHWWIPRKGQRRGALMFSLICVWINGWVNNREAGDLRRYRTHYDVIVMALDELGIKCFSPSWTDGDSQALCVQYQALYDMCMCGSSGPHLNRPVSQIRAPPGGLSRTSGKLWQDYSNCYMFWTWNAISFNLCSIHLHCGILAHP